MKTITAILITLLLVSCNLKKHDANTYNIHGLIKGNQYSGYVYLNTPHTKDSVLVKDNAFEFTGTVPHPVQGWITLEEKGKLAWLYVENNELLVTLNNTNKKLLVTDVLGSESYEKQERIEHFIIDNYKKGNFTQAVKDTLTAFINQNPKHSLSGKYLGQIATDTWALSANEVKTLKAKLDTTQQSSTDLFVINQSIKKLETYGIGTTFKEFDLLDVNGNTQNTASATSNYVLVDFWASWCVPCRRQNPHLVDVHKKFNTKGFDIFSQFVASFKVM